MRSDADRAFSDAFELGGRNAEIIELARRHCLNMQFQQSGGRGMAKEMSGLPIHMRRVHCPFGSPANSMSMNLEGIVVDFFESYREGCPHVLGAEDLAGRIQYRLSPASGAFRG